MRSSQFILNTPIAHRGLHNENVPENSLGAFSLAMEKNLPIEFDLHLSKDGKLFVFHDYSLERMTGDLRACEDLTLKELQELRLKDSQERIPSFQDLLRLVKGKVPLVIELKCYTREDHMAKILMEELANYDGEFAIQSFNPMPLTWLRRHYPDSLLGLLSGSFEGANILFHRKILLRYLLATPMVRPDYFGLEFFDRPTIQSFLAKYIFNKPIVHWTIDKEKDYLFCLKKGRNVIFEAFLPQLNGNS
ncbi:glycerophosphodiester phosphodiesterase domain protein [Bacteriovorax sp. BSW11_IV]|uniref:glycerophosphodiester phosphodiesterase family protein n=1 Tax=Bacteriovorax sp. BSW11_IV TaxID=1353529 RepID=UPI00038A0EF6|nr:glycerophosphodiester phosphodiesterase family protein [Bacteriovorax sp. BSW11_IV]EQC44958.1 glycerophosphodiester phosphodiesterase domain protein [Bacteriovorax sp. BSW11_IV]